MRSSGIFTSLLSLSISQFLPVVFSSNVTQCQPWTVDKPNRIFVLSDIANEPDDTMSLVRLLAHSDMYTVEGLVAITSFWLPNATYPSLIQDLVDAYGTVRSNLQSHSNRTFPTAEELTSKVKSGPVSYGMEAIKDLEEGGDLSEGAQLLIDAVDASDEPLYVQVWGGANTLASALWQVNRTRSASELQAFTSKLRVYSISDQDDTGEWIRHYFYDIRFIGSRAGFNQYFLSAWIGISSPSADRGGPNQDIVSNDWLRKNIQIGELGKHYPDVKFIMEGDTPALLYNFQNGLNVPEQPAWGSWGGRYTPNPFNHYANSKASQYMDTTDEVVGLNGLTYKTNQATIWRWREPIQHEFAARMQWTLSAYNVSSNTTHPPVVIVNESCGSSPLELDVNVGDTVVLDATKTYSPDASANLNFTWSQYLDPSCYQNSTAIVPKLNFTSSGSSDSKGSSPAGSVVSFTVPEPTFGDCVLPENVTKFGQYGEQQKCPVLHAILTVKDSNAVHPIVRYKRVVLRVQPYTKQ